LSEVILGILDWDSQHLFEFRIQDRVYAHLIFLGEDDLFVDAQNPCVSCGVPIRLLGLSIADVFTYIFDYGDYHTFRLTVLGAVPTASGIRPTPKLLAWEGQNPVQYPGLPSLARLVRAPEHTRIEAPQGGRRGPSYVAVCDESGLQQLRDAISTRRPATRTPGERHSSVWPSPSARGERSTFR
jgi:pRiA4b ORF-3-like protein